MNNYKRGYVLERMVFKELTKLGYFVVRSAGSHTKVDIIAISESTIKLIQLKRVKGRYFSFTKEMGELKELSKKLPSNCVVELWVYLDRLKGIRPKPRIEVILI